ncbi:hypothetical protein [Microbacterium binotii]|uniref:Uncharacterized protein n=1 Tax=Microbacterium binotii TaxID=462710 RepID=A0ABN3PBK0_9MICO
MPKRLTRYVNVPRNAEFITLSPGETLPDWAEPLVTNPAAFEEIDAEPADAAASGGQTTTEHPANTTPSKPARDAIVDRAKELGVKASGKSEEILARIAEKEAALAAESNTAAADTADGAEDAQTRPDLEAKATALGIEFTTETTDAELELAISTHEE